VRLSRAGVRIGVTMPGAGGAGAGADGAGAGADGAGAGADGGAAAGADGAGAVQARQMVSTVRCARWAAAGHPG